MTEAQRQEAIKACDRILAAQDSFDERRRYRESDLISALKLAYEEIHHPGAARAVGKDVDAIVSDALHAHAQPRVAA